MSNILDYLKWRNDLTFSQDLFNVIDSLVLSRFVYIRWEEILKNESCLISEAYQKFLSMDTSSMHILADEDPTLFELVGNSNRFKDCTISDFVHVLDEENMIQFCAMCIHLSDKTHYVCFRGTDNTLVGWKEDLYMSFKPDVPAQRLALDYLKRIAKKYRGKLRLGGHSKGGNLALYSSLFAPKYIQRRIMSVDNFDGPGLSKENYELKKDLEIYQKIHVYCPQNSMIGRMLYHDETKIKLIYSNGKGPWQHDLYTWQILNKQFHYVNEFETSSEIIENSLKEFMEKVTPEQRKQCIDIIFESLESTNEDTFHEFSLKWFKNSTQVVKYVSKIQPDERKVVMDAIKMFMSIMFDEYKSTIVQKEGNEDGNFRLQI